MTRDKRCHSFITCKTFGGQNLLSRKEIVPKKPIIITETNKYYTIMTFRLL